MVTFKSTYDSGCQPPAIIEIDGVEVPYVNEGVRTTIRKDGMLSATRRSEVTIPLEWGNGIPATAVNALVGGPDPMQHVHIKLRDPPEEPSTSAYTTVHHGYVRAAGPGTDEGTGRIVVGSFSEWFEKIPASMTFTLETTAASVVSEVRDTFIENCPIVDDLEVVGVDSTAPVIDPVQEARDFIDGLRPAAKESMLIPIFGPFAAMASLADGEVADVIPEFDQPELEKSFTADRDTLLDVLLWLEEKLGVYIKFAATEGDTPTLVFDTNPTGVAFFDHEHVAPERVSSQPVDVITNNALYQLNPLFAITARGHSKKSIRAKVERALSSGQYPHATAIFEPLADRIDASGTADPSAAPAFEADVVTVNEAENAAKKELKRQLDEVAGGEMHLRPTPGMVPFASIRAVPECQHVALVDLPPINYEAEEVIHEIPAPTDDAEPPKTIVRCSLFTDPEQIRITDSGLNDL